MAGISEKVCGGITIEGDLVWVLDQGDNASLPLGVPWLFDLPMALEVQPLSGDKLQQLTREIFASDPKLLQRVREILKWSDSGNWLL